jgi:alkylation response protein AidB-like acyl-CoA dehydrogenase
MSADVTVRVPVQDTHADAVAVADLVARALEAGVVDRDRTGVVEAQREALAVVDGSGLLGLTVGRVHGGPGLGPETLAEVVRILAAVDPSIAQVPQGHWLMVDVLAVLGGEHLRERLFRDVLAGQRIGNALAERGGGHAQDLATRLLGGPGERPILRGRKYYCTGALTARWIAVSALDERDRLVLAFVAGDAPGVAVDTDWDVIGQRATISGTATFDDVEVDPGLVLDYARAFEVPQQLGARAQLVHAAIEAGIAGGALRDARAYLRERARPSSEAVRAGARAASEDPTVRLRYGRLATRVRAAEALLASAAAELAAVGLVPADEHAAARGSLAVAAAKAFASDVAVETASELFALCGTSATAAAHDLDRHWRNARTHSVHDPVDWKYLHIAAYEVDGVVPPNHGQL